MRSIPEIIAQNESKKYQMFLVRSDIGLTQVLFYLDTRFKQQRYASYDLRKTAEHFNS